MNIIRPFTAYCLLVIFLLCSGERVSFSKSLNHLDGRIRFGTISFDPGSMWVVANQGETMLLTPNNPALSGVARVKIGPATTGMPNTVIAQLAPGLSAGKQLKGPAIDDSDLLMGGGGKLYRHLMHFQDGSGAFILIAEVGQHLTPIVLTTDNAMASNMGWVFFIQLIMTLKGEADAEPGGPTAGGIGFPSDLGEDDYDKIKWRGPDEWGFGVYDIHPINVKKELKVIALQTPEFIGTVTAAPMTFDQAIGNLRKLADSPWTQKQYLEFKELGVKDPFTLQGAAFNGILSGQPVMALLQLFAAYEVHPEDPNNWLNLAAMCSHVRMANESTAILKEMSRRGLKPDPPVVSADAAIEYLTGYNQLLFGQTLTAKGHLHHAIDLDPFLKEAAIALAYAQKMTGEEEAAEATYTQGVWRRRPSQVLICGGTGSGRDDDGPDIRPPITDMLDVSHGTPGVLPNFDHPNNWSEAVGLMDRYGRTLRLMKETAAGQSQIANAAAQKIGTHGETAIEKWYEYMDSLFLTLRVQEPSVKKALAAKDKAGKELEDAVKAIGKQTAPKVMQISMQPGNHHNELAAVATENVALLKPFAQNYDKAVRRLFKIEHRFQTGLAAQLGDNDWHDLETARLQVEQLSAYNELAGILIGSYSLVASIVPAPPQGPISVDADAESVLKCPDGVRNLGFKLTVDVPLLPLKAGLKAQCDKLSAEVSVYPWELKEKGVLELAAGGFVQADFTGKGDVTIFTGVTGKAGVGTAGITGKSGVYVTTNVHTGEVKDLGVKASVDQSAKLGDILSVSAKAGELKSSALPSIPQVARGSDLSDTRRMSP